MSDNPLKDVVNELIPYFERLETETAASSSFSRKRVWSRAKSSIAIWSRQAGQAK